MIPIRDINPTSRTAWLTLAIIAVNVAVFVLWEPTFAGQAKQQEFLFCNAEIPFEVAHQTTLRTGERRRVRRSKRRRTGEGAAAGLQDFLGQRCPDKSWLASIFVSMFLHGGWLHLAGNMLFLWIFGNNVEDRLGRITFVRLLHLGGLAATGLQLAFDPNSAVPNVGASGGDRRDPRLLPRHVPEGADPHARHLLLHHVPRASRQLRAVAWFVLQFFSGVGEMGHRWVAVSLLGPRGRLRVRTRRDVALLPITRATAATRAATTTSSLRVLSQGSCRGRFVAGKLGDRRAG